MELTERFVADELDRSVWVPWYLPHWSSRAGTRATFRVGGGEFRLSIPTGQPLWAEGVHETPLRVSGIQSANFSGPVGSTIGGQPFRPDQRVREEQPEFWGCSVGQSPDYPVQLEIAVFDFPDRAHLVEGPVPVPAMIVSAVTVSEL